MIRALLLRFTLAGFLVTAFGGWAQSITADQVKWFPVNNGATTFMIPGLHSADSILLSTPAHRDSIFSQQTASFSWTADVNFSFYEIMLYSDLDKSVQQAASWIVTEPQFVISGLPTGDYQWRVRSVNENGKPLSFQSIAYEFSVITAPDIYYPKEHSLVAESPVVASWQAVKDVTSYNVALASHQDGEFTTLLQTSTSQTQLDVTAQIFFNDRKDGYALRVQSQKSSGELSSWSAWRYFGVTGNEPEKPATVSLLSPANNSEAVSPLPDFTWHKIDNASQYELEMYVQNHDDDFELFNSAVVSANYALSPSTLVYGRHYAWRVRALNNTVAGEFSDFFYVNAPVSWPEAAGEYVLDLPSVTITSPASGNIFINDTTFGWTPGEGYSDKAVYTVSLSKKASSGSQWPIVFSTVTKAPWVVFGQLLPISANLKLSVGVVDGFRLAKSVHWFGSAVAQGSLVAPQIIKPLNNAVINTPDFEWQAADDADFYRIEIMERNAQGQLLRVLEDTANGTLYQAGYHFDSSKQYAWRVRSEGNNGDFSFYNDFSYFSIDAGAEPSSGNNPSSTSNTLPQYTNLTLDTPLPTNPANNDVVAVTSPTFSWQAVDDATHYQVELVRYNGQGYEVMLQQVVDTTSFQSTADLSLEVVKAEAGGSQFGWRVRALNNQKHISEFSPMAYFDLDASLFLLASPQLVSPYHNSLINSLSPELVWQTEDNVESYRVQLFAIGAEQNEEMVFEQVVENSLQGQQSIKLNELLRNGGKYRWAVEAINGLNRSPKSEFWAFSPKVSVNTAGEAFIRQAAAIRCPDTLGDDFNYRLFKQRNLQGRFEAFPSPMLSWTERKKDMNWGVELNDVPVDSYHLLLQRRDWIDGGEQITTLMDETVGSQAMLHYLNQNGRGAIKASLHNTCAYKLTVTPNFTAPQEQLSDELGANEVVYFDMVQQSWRDPRTTPHLQSPADMADLTVGLPTFTWAEVPGASGYKFLLWWLDEEDRNYLFVHIEELDSNTTEYTLRKLRSMGIPGFDHLQPGKFQWAVEPRFGDKYDTRSRSPGRFFQIVSPPTTPVLTYYTPNVAGEPLNTHYGDGKLTFLGLAEYFTVIFLEYNEHRPVGGSYGPRYGTLIKGKVRYDEPIGRHYHYDIDLEGLHTRDGRRNQAPVPVGEIIPPREDHPSWMMRLYPYSGNPKAMATEGTPLDYEFYYNSNGSHQQQGDITLGTITYRLPHVPKFTWSYPTGTNLLNQSITLKSRDNRLNKTIKLDNDALSYEYLPGLANSEIGFYSVEVNAETTGLVRLTSKPLPFGVRVRPRIVPIAMTPAQYFKDFDGQNLIDPSSGDLLPQPDPTSRRPHFIWQPYAGGAGVVTDKPWSDDYQYRLEVQQLVGGAWSTVVTEVTDPGATSHVLTANSQLNNGDHDYRWRVQAYDATLVSGWSSWAYFEIADPTQQLEIFRPLDGAVSESRPVFAWSHVDGHERYRFSLKQCSASTYVVSETTLTVPFYELDGPLTTGTEYCWTVKSLSIDGSQIGQVNSRFSVEAVPTHPVDIEGLAILSPTENQLVYKDSPGLLFNNVDDLADGEYMLTLIRIPVDAPQNQDWLVNDMALHEGLLLTSESHSLLNLRSVLANADKLKPGDELIARLYAIRVVNDVEQRSEIKEVHFRVGDPNTLSEFVHLCGEH